MSACPIVVGIDFIRKRIKSLDLRLILINHELPCCGYFAVKLQRIVLYLHVEGLFIAVEFKVIWHSPRVPAGAVSPEGHNTLGDFFAIGSCDNYLWIE